MTYKKVKIRTTGIIFALLIILVCFGLLFYNNHLKGKLHASTEASLMEVLEQQKFNFTSELNSEMNTIKSLAISLSYLPEDKNEVKLFMNEALAQCGFDDIMVANTDGIGLTLSGESVDLSLDEHFNEAMNGKTIIIEPKNTVTENKLISIMTPVNRSGEVVGILNCSYNIGQFDELLLSSFAGKGYSFVINKDGDIIARTNNNYVLLSGDNLFKSLELAKIEKYDNIDKIKENINARIGGRIEYSVDDEVRHAHYAPLDINEWSLFTVVTEEVVEYNAKDIMSGAVALTFSVVIGFIVFYIYILRLQQKSDREKELHTRELEKAAYYDELTGLPNLNKFKIDAVNIIKSNMNKNFVAAKIDIINFKVLNEMFGYDTADKTIYNMAQFIMEIKRRMGINKGCLARINADEFILLDEADTIEETYERISKFEAGFNEISKGFLENHKIRFRYGRYMINNGETCINDIIEKVNLAHRMAKQQNLTIYDYNDSMMDKHIRDAELEGRMSESLESGEFKVYLQPKYLLSDETIVGAEALVRWKADDEDIIFPNDFIPLFERNGSITKLDMYMFEEVCKIIRAWIDEGYNPIPISVNFSRNHLQNDNFVNELNIIADRYNVPKKYLELELTENSIYDNEKALREIIDKLHISGFTLSMDDFGTGYSSLGLLKNISVDTIKIDKGFFSDIIYETRAKTVIESIIDMAKKLCIDTVAEGVETKEHIDLLKEIGCDIVQGYYYARPMPVEEFSKSMYGEVMSNE